MESRQLLDIPRGERRHYHDDVSIVVISFEGRIWRSSVSACLGLTRFQRSKASS
jgi:hypothetical protein